ncbi:MAG: hypothetical protein ABI353_18175 [Isosphaeraceae bacterium]
MPGTISEAAAEARSHFTSKTRNDGSAFWSCDHDTTPEWVQDMARAAHGEMFPDEWRYAFIVEALDLLEEDEDAEPDADVCTSNLTAWLASRNDRLGYCDDAREEFAIREDATLFDRLQAGQLAERSEVHQAVHAALMTRMDFVDDDA